MINLFMSRASICLDQFHESRELFIIILYTPYVVALAVNQSRWLLWRGEIFPRISLVRLMKPCFPVFSVQPWSALPRPNAARTRPPKRTEEEEEEEEEKGGGCTRVLKLSRALGLRKNEAEKWLSQPPDNSIVRRRVDEHDVSCAGLEFCGLPRPRCLPIPFGGQSAVNYSRGALRRIYTARSWRSSRINRPKWMRCANKVFWFRFLFLSRARGRKEMRGKSWELLIMMNLISALTHKFKKRDKSLILYNFILFISGVSIS